MRTSVAARLIAPKPKPRLAPGHGGRRHLGIVPESVRSAPLQRRLAGTGGATMPPLELTALQVWQLRELTRTAVGRVALRALMVLWRAEGLTTLEIAERLECHRDTVSLWLERYRTLGTEGLEDEPRSGRPPHLDAAAREQLDSVLDQA